MSQAKMRQALTWSDISHATDEEGGQWAINSEQVRGEGRLYWLERCPMWARSVIDKSQIDTAHHDQRTVRRRVEQIRGLRDV